jgi:hypothetical protein
MSILLGNNNINGYPPMAITILKKNYILMKKLATFATVYRRSRKSS